MLWWQKTDPFSLRTSSNFYPFLFSIVAVCEQTNFMRVCVYVFS